MNEDTSDCKRKTDNATDVLTPEQRSFVMSRIRSKDTKPEMLLRRGLHERGLRCRLHRADLPGKPDLVFPKYNAVVFVHGCFWHGHGCSLFKWPQTRSGFWKTKITHNIERDRKVRSEVRAAGWRMIVVWECALKGKYRRLLQDVLNDVENFVRNDQKQVIEIAEASMNYSLKS